MSLYAKTVYPRLAGTIGDDELALHFTPTEEELEFTAQAARSPGSRLSLLVLLKLFQTLHRFPGPDEIPAAVVHHVRIRLRIGEGVAFECNDPFQRARQHHAIRAHSYTWSHAIDDASGLRVNSTGNVYNRQADRGNSEFDIRHQYVGSAIYELPWLKSQQGIAGHLAGGWSVAVIETLHTGLPFNITEPNDRCLCDGGGQRPDFLGGTVQFVDPRLNMFGAQNAYFNGTGGGSATAAGNPYFQRVGSGTSVTLGAGRYGNLGRDVFHGPGVINTDMSVSKGARITERQAIELRGEAFNFFNHTNFLNPSGNIGSSTFGRITTALDPRLIQITARYTF